MHTAPQSCNIKWRGYSQAHNSWEPTEQVHAPELVDRFHQENPKAIRAICLKEDKLDSMETMPYIHPDNAACTFGSTATQTFFQQGGPYSPIIHNSDQRPVVTIKMLLGPNFQHPQDHHEPSNSEEEGEPSSSRASHSTYGTPLSSSPMAHSDEPSLSYEDDYRPDQQAIDEVWRTIFSTAWPS
jgi:hypothetical protein